MRLENTTISTVLMRICLGQSHPRGIFFAATAIRCLLTEDACQRGLEVAWAPGFVMAAVENIIASQRDKSMKLSSVKWSKHCVKFAKVLVKEFATTASARYTVIDASSWSTKEAILRHTANTTSLSESALTNATLQWLVVTCWAYCEETRFGGSIRPSNVGKRDYLAPYDTYILTFEPSC